MADDNTLRRAYERVMNTAEPGHISDETWEALALRELTDAERDAVSRHVASCAECSEIYRSLRELEDGARGFDAAVPAPIPVHQRGRRAWYALAASGALFAVGVFSYRAFVGPSDITEIAQPAAPPVTVMARIEVTPPDVQLSASRALVTRGSGDQQAFLESFGTAIEPYRAGRYAEAATALAPVADRYPDAYEPRFYHAASLLLAGDSQAALAALDRVRPLAPAEWQDQIRYLRAAALQGSGDIDGARAELRVLCAGSGAYRDRSCALLK